LTIYERLPIDFICRESWWDLLNGSSSTIREGSWPFTKGSPSILIARNHDDIYWMEALQRLEKQLNCLRKVPCRFYLHGVAMAFIELKLFLDKRTNLTVSERLPSILFARSRDGIYWRGALTRWEKELDRLRKAPHRFYLHGVVMAFIEWELFHDERRNLTVDKRLSFKLIYTKS
jgi:hypothetical protein